MLYRQEVSKSASFFKFLEELEMEGVLERIFGGKNGTLHTPTLLPSNCDFPGTPRFHPACLRPLLSPPTFLCARQPRCRAP